MMVTGQTPPTFSSYPLIYQQLIFLVPQSFFPLKPEVRTRYLFLKIFYLLENALKFKILKRLYINNAFNDRFPELGRLENFFFQIQDPNPWVKTAFTKFRQRCYNIYEYTLHTQLHIQPIIYISFLNFVIAIFSYRYLLTTFHLSFDNR